MGLLTKRPRSATVTCETAVQVDILIQIYSIVCVLYHDTYFVFIFGFDLIIVVIVLLSFVVYGCMSSVVTFVVVCSRCCFCI